MKFEFNPKNHSYTLEVDGVKKRLTGVTTILGVISKPFLLPWAVKMATEYVKNNFDATKHIIPEELDILLAEAKKAHAQKRDKAGDVGIATHGLCENWIRTKYLKLPAKENPEYDKLPNKKMADKMFDNFANWAKENKVKFLASEKQVYSEKFWYAGTADMIIKINDKTYLGDIKTGSGIYLEMFAQCAGYQIAIEEMNPKQKIDGHIIVNLKKDGTIKTQVNEDFEGYKKVFLSALIIYRELIQNNGKR